MLRMILTKSQFADFVGVSRGRVSQWIAEGKLTEAEMVGTGFRAKIDVERAMARLKITLDPSQMLNAKTRLGNSVAFILDDAQHLDVSFRRARLEALQSRNRKLQAEEIGRRGAYVPRADHDAIIAALPARLLREFENELPALAAGFAREFKVPQAEVEAFIRGEFEQIQRRAAERSTKESGQ
jgi:hypothetical protein